jgi:ribosomal protein L40E
VDQKLCSTCGAAGPAEAQFCVECGATLRVATGATQKLPTLRCGGCQAVLPPYARFCPLCGHTVGAKPAPTAARPQRLAPPTPVAAPQLRPVPSAPMPQHRYRWRHTHSAPFSPWVLWIGLLLCAPFLGALFLPAFVFVALLSGMLAKGPRGRRKSGAGKLIFLVGLVYLLMSGNVWPYVLLLALASFVVGTVLDRGW